MASTIVEQDLDGAVVDFAEGVHLLLFSHVVVP